MATSPRHRVVIVGSGFGGLFAAKFLRRAPVAVTLIDRTNHHLFQPLLYQVATGILSPGDIATATRDVLRKHDNVSVVLGEVTGFDLDARTVAASGPDGRPLTLSYDSLVVAAGVGQSYFGHDEFAQWAPGMKTLDDALAQHARIFGAFEMAELEEDPDTRKAWLTFVVVGGGPTGVEISGQIAELSRRALKQNFTRFDPADARVVLFDGGPEILASFGDRLSGQGDERTRADGGRDPLPLGRHPRRRERRRRQGARRSRAADRREDSDLGSRSAAHRCADARGRLRRRTRPGRPHQGFARLLTTRPPGGLRRRRHDELRRSPRRRRGRDAVRHPRSEDDQAPPGSDEPQPFKYRDVGSMACVSRRRAIVSFHGIRVSGFLGWLMWLVVHITFMTGFKNRFKTLTGWLFSFLGSGRTERALRVERIDR